VTDDQARLFERIRQRRGARAAAEGAIAAPRPAVGADRGAAPATGARVFDPITGQEGVILGRTTETVHL